jgi:AcrR family transcriptional regulator
LTSSGRSRAYHHGNLRAELLDAAIAQLDESPAEQLSLRAIARSLGVSQTAPYRHFCDKEALLAAMATRGYRQLLSCLQEALESAGDTAAQRLRALARAYVDYAASHERLFKLMFGPLVQPGEQYPELRQVSRETLTLVQQILERGMIRGEFRRQDVTYLANAAWAGIHGVATLRIDSPALFKRYVDLSRQIDVAVDTFLAGIAPGARVP